MGGGGILYFPDALLICSLFFFFMFVVASTGRKCSKWVENSDVKKHFFKVATPETITCNV